MTVPLQVAERWFRAEDAGDGVTRLTEPHVDPMLEANVWHVRGRDADLMIDAANGIGPLRPAIAELAGARPVIAVVTHGHFDHVGGLHEFDDRRGHAADAAETARPYAMRMRRPDFPDDAEEMFAYYGVPVPEVLVTALPDAGFDLEGWVSPGAELTSTLRDGDTIELGDRRVEILHVPGHTPGSIALWEPDARLLFTGDAIYVDARLSFDDREAAEASMRRMAAMPVRRVHAGHERSFDGDELRAVIDAELST